jgi:hypothetical protein
MLERILEGLLTVSPQKEAILRSIISSTEIPGKEKSIENIIETIVESVTTFCAPMLELPQQRRLSEFQNRFKKFLNGAILLWNYAQRSQSRVIATSKFEDGADWEIYGEHGNVEDASDKALHSTPPPIIKVLFPYVFQISNNTPIHIHYGFTIGSDQPVYKAAQKEYSTQYKRVSGPNSEVLSGAGRVRKLLQKVRMECLLK